MIIKLKCTNDKCDYCYEVPEEDLKGARQKCLICGSLLKVTEDSLKEVVQRDLYASAEAYISGWVAQNGWDWTLDLIQRNRSQPAFQIYKEILKAIPWMEIIQLLYLLSLTFLV